MLWRSARAACLVLVVSTFMPGVCPLAPAMSAASPHASHCPSKSMPAEHSCCVSGHHAPALVRSGLDSVVMVSAPAPVRQTAATAGDQVAARGEFFTSSPPWFSHSVLRI